MRNVFILVITLLVSISAALGQSTPSVPPNPQQNPSAPVYARVEVILTKTLDARKSKAGDVVLARTADEFALANGVQVPKNTRLIAHLTEVQSKGHGFSESRLGLVFDKIQLRDGREIPVSMLVEKIIPMDISSEAIRGSAFQSTLSAGARASKSIRIQSQAGNATIFQSSLENLRVESGAHLVVCVIEQ